jgi:hypothetical protein
MKFFLVTEPKQSSEWALNPFTGIYKKSSIIPGTGAAIWSKNSFGPTANHHTVPSALAFI